MFLHATDEMPASPKSMVNNKGRAVLGERLVLRQIKISSRSFSVIATSGIH